MALATAATHGVDPSKLFLIQKGPVVLKPQLEVSTAYTDNINFRGENKLSDIFALVSPGLAVQVGSKDYNFLELSYFYDRQEYIEERTFNANQHRAAIDSHFERSRFTLEGHDRIESLSSPLGGGVSLAGQMVKRLVITDSYRLNYELSERTGLYVGIDHTSYDYRGDIALYDSRSLIGTLGFLYKAFSRTFFFGELYYGQTENEPNVPVLPDYATARFVGGFVGARGSFTENLTGTVKAGYESREYSDNSEGTGAPVVEAGLTQRFTEATSVTLAYSRRQQESVQFVRSSYVSDSISASLTQLFGSDGRLRGILQAAYYSAQYEPNPQYAIAERSDDVFTMGLTMTYDIKLWMRVRGGYTFEKLKSNEPSVIDYTVNRVTLGLELGY